MNMLRFDDVTKVFGGGTGLTVVAIDGLTLEVKCAEWVLMLGENGSGKSTLLKLVTGELKPDKGEIWLAGAQVSEMQPHKRSRFVTHIHQSRDAGLPKSLTVREVLRLALETSEGTQLRRRDCERAVYERLEVIREGLSRVASEQLWHLSGGEHQLVALAVASALADDRGKRGHLLLLDEHVSQLDPHAREVVMGATERLIRRLGLSAIMATHDCDLASRYGDRRVILRRGRVAYSLSAGDGVTSASELRMLLND